MDQLLLAQLAVFCAGVLRGMTGFGLALAAVPMLSLFMLPAQAVVMVQCLQLATAPVDIARHRAVLDFASLRPLMVGGLLGTPAGVLLAAPLDPDALRVVIAAIILMGLAAVLAGLRLPAGRAAALSAGLCSGLFAGLAAMPGPPAVAYYLGRRIDQGATRASLLVFFGFTAAVALATSALTGEALLQAALHSLAALPALLAGSWVGGLIFRRLSGGGYRLLAAFVLALTALATGLSGLRGLAAG